jgi:hypothetical protein
MRRSRVPREFSVDCCHANQDKFWVADPDGGEWEVYVFTHDLEDGAACATDVQHASGSRGLTLAESGSCCSSS